MNAFHRNSIVSRCSKSGYARHAWVQNRGPRFDSVESDYLSLFSIIRYTMKYTLENERFSGFYYILVNMLLNFFLFSRDGVH